MTWTALGFPNPACAGTLAPGMAYPIELARAAQRHLEAAMLLDQTPPSGKRDVAGYLYGIAAECALKQIMWYSGMRPTDERDDPFFLHFPALKTVLRDCARGRHAGRLSAHARDSRLMAEWDVKMRYADGPSVLGKPIDRWSVQARSLVQEMHGT